jgi:hypothetical protein
VRIRHDFTTAHTELYLLVAIVVFYMFIVAFYMFLVVFYMFIAALQGRLWQGGRHVH